MKTKNIRLVVVAVIFLVLSAGLIGYVGLRHAFGLCWQQIAALCPLGAFTTMIATKNVHPARRGLHRDHGHFVFSGRPRVLRVDLPGLLLQKVKEFCLRNRARRRRRRSLTKRSRSRASSSAARAAARTAPRSAPPRARKHSRHYVLGGALLSTAIFGFRCFAWSVRLASRLRPCFGVAPIRVRRHDDRRGACAAHAHRRGVCAAQMVHALLSACRAHEPRGALQQKTALPVINETKCLENGERHALARAAPLRADINLRHPRLR